MINLFANCLGSLVLRLLVTTSLAIMLPIAACHKQETKSVETGPRTFASTQDAGKALANAAGLQDQNSLKQIFGSGSEDLLSTGDAVEDKSSLEGFAKDYQVMNRWRKLDDSTELLLVGADNHAFPIPLMKNASGQWYFNAAAGKEDLSALRIGRNEITAILTSSAMVDAQHEYFSQSHGGVKQYAQRFISDPGQQDGLYWESSRGSNRSPLGPLVALATPEGYRVHPNQHQPFNGYYFAMLDKQGSDAQGGAKNYIVNGKMTGGFAFVAYPAQYGDSGIMTFIVNQSGVVFQKDLGKATGEIASALTEFNPDKNWTAIRGTRELEE
jgi:hypothetical protein